MREITGIDTFKELQKKNPNIIGIFISSHIGYISEIFRLKAFQFLIKPLKKLDITKELDRAIDHYHSLHYKHMISYKGVRSVFEVREILYIEILGRQLNLQTYYNSYNYNGNLRNEFTLLEGHNFVQIHKGCIVNMAHVRSYNKKEFILYDEKCLYLSKKYKDTALECLSKYLASQLIK